jgi:4-amino-4-deoxy-L-arabinose transferase-like glycosyltransferase
VTSRAARWLVLALCAAAVARTAWFAWDASWTFDEPAHLSWSERLVDDGTTARPGTFDNSKTPLLVPHVLARKTAAALGADYQMQRFAARAPTIVFYALLLLAIHRVAHRAGGARTAALATCAAALDPNLAAHGGLATVDVAFALATLWCLDAAVRLREHPRRARGVELGLALAFAFTAKFSALLLVPCALAAAGPRTWRHLLLALAVATITIDLTYALHFGDFVGGIAQCLSDERGREWNGYVLGRTYPDGVWFYMIVHWAVKTPLALALATIAGLAAARPRTPLVRTLAIAAAVFLLYFSVAFRTQVGLRFALMVLPLAYIVAATGLARLVPRIPEAVPVVLTLALIELAPYTRDPLAFTNTLIPDKRLAYRVVADSNLLWGQTRDRVTAWLRRHPGVRHNPRRLGLGTNVLDANWLSGVWRPDRFPCARARFTPDRHLYFTHLVFDIDLARLAAMRELCPGEVEPLPSDRAGRAASRATIEQR